MPCSGIDKTFKIEIEVEEIHEYSSEEDIKVIKVLKRSSTSKLHKSLNLNTESGSRSSIQHEKIQDPIGYFEKKMKAQINDYIKQECLDTDKKVTRAKTMKP